MFTAAARRRRTHGLHLRTGQITGALRLRLYQNSPFATAWVYNSICVFIAYATHFLPMDLFAVFQSLAYDWQNVMLGVRVWMDGANPYDPYMMSDGHMSPPLWFVYPPHALYLLAPLALLPLWLSSLLWTVLVWVGWELWVRAETGQKAMVTLLWIPIVNHMILGQFTLPLLLVLAVVWRCWDSRYLLFWGPPVLALITFKPQIVALPLLVIGIRAVRERRWAFLGLCLAWLLGVWLLPLIADNGRLYRLWLAQVLIYSGQKFYLLTYWPTLVAASLLVLVWWKTAQSRDPLYLAFGATALMIPISGPYSVVGLLFPALAGGSCYLLALGVSLIGLLSLIHYIDAFVYQLVPAMAALIVGMLLQYMIRKRKPIQFQG